MTLPSAAASFNGLSISSCPPHTLAHLSAPSHGYRFIAAFLSVWGGPIMVRLLLWIPLWTVSFLLCHVFQCLLLRTHPHAQSDPSLGFKYDSLSNSLGHTGSWCLCVCVEHPSYILFIHSALCVAYVSSAPTRFPSINLPRSLSLLLCYRSVASALAGGGY